MKEYDYKKMTPFKFFVLQNFPFIEEDFDAITNWQLFEKIGHEMNKVIKVVNDMGVTVEYISNYFDNLDVQNEVNKKLDEMAESGELTEIIAQYLDLQGILAYNTVSDLSNADNMANGSFAKTYGKTTYNDGEGAFYKIRTLLNTDVIDGDNLVALVNYPTLVAEKMTDAEISALNTKIGTITNLNTTNKNNLVVAINEVNTKIGTLANLNTTEKTNIVGAINEVNNKINEREVKPYKPYGMKKIIIIGDSYASREDNWVTRLVSLLGIGGSDYYKSAKGSTGFVSSSEGKTWLTLLTDVLDTLTTEQKAEITHVIVCGGANDNTYTESTITSAIATFVATVNSNLPNARTLIGEIGWTNNPSNIVNYAKVVDVYSKCSQFTNCYYLQNVQYTLHNYNYLLSDGVHPTEAGNIALANNIHQAIMYGTCDIIYGQLQHKLNPNDNLKTFYESLNNNIACVYNNRPSYFSGDFGNVTANGTTAINLTDSIFEYVVGSYFESNRTFVVANLNVNGTRQNVNCMIGVYQGKLKLYPFSVNSAGSYDTLSNITQIFIPQFKIVMDSLQC